VVRVTVATMVLLLVLCPLCLFGQTAEQPALFVDGDRVCFIGDSITHGDENRSDYHEFIYLYYLTRFPDRRITVFDRGMSGDTSWGTVARFAEDIAPCRATVSTIMLGMNDVDRGLYGSLPECPPEIQAKRDARLALYRENMEQLCNLVTEAGSRIILFTPSPYDQESISPDPELRIPERPQVNDGLLVCARHCRELAETFGAALVDMNSGMLQIAREQLKVDPTFPLNGKYRVHLGSYGHFIMAYLFLKAQGAPAVVSTVKIDAAGNRLVNWVCAGPTT